MPPKSGVYNFSFLSIPRDLKWTGRSAHMLWSIPLLLFFSAFAALFYFYRSWSNSPGWLKLLIFVLAIPALNLVLAHIVRII